VRTTNIGLLYPNVRNNIGGDIPIDVPQPKYWRGCVPGIPGVVDASDWRSFRGNLADCWNKNNENLLSFFAQVNQSKKKPVLRPTLRVCV